MGKAGTKGTQNESTTSRTKASAVASTGIWCLLILCAACSSARDTGAQESTSPMAKTNVIERIARVDEVHAETMAENPTEIKVETLPFYKKFKLLLATVDLPQRPVLLRYADDGSHVITLDASPEHIYEVNKLEDLHLQAPHVASYLRFFLENSGGDAYHIVETEKEVNWLKASGQDPEVKALKEKCIAMLHAIKITALPDGGHFANATAIRGRNLAEISVKVHVDGHVEILAEKTVLSNIPVAEVAW